MRSKFNLFSFPALFLIFTIFYYVVPLIIFDSFGKVAIQNITVWIYDNSKIIYSVCLIVALSLTLFFFKDNNNNFERYRSYYLNSSKLFMPIYIILIIFNLLFLAERILNLDINNFLELNRNELLINSNSKISESLSLICKLLLISFCVVNSIICRKFKFLYPLLIILIADISILSRGLILALIIGLGSFLNFTNYKYKKSYFIVFIAAIFFMRQILTGHILDVFDTSENRFEFLGEFMNTFSGAVLLSNGNFDLSSELAFNSIYGYFKPPIIPNFFEFPEAISPAMIFDEFFSANYNISGLAGGLLMEMIVFSPIFCILLIFIIFLFLRFIINTKSYILKIFYIFCLIQLPSVFRWSLFTYVGNNIFSMIYIFLPLLIVEFFSNQKIKKFK
jgi:hypothetical protein